MLHHVIILLAPAQIVGGKVLVRPLVQGMKAPVKAVDVDVHMDTMWGITAHLVLEVGYKLVAGVLSAASLVTGSGTTAVGPDLIESGVHYERVKLAHGVFAKKGVSKTGVSKLKIKEMGSRYWFIILYCLVEKWLSVGDFRKDI